MNGKQREVSGPAAPRESSPGALGRDQAAPLSLHLCHRQICICCPALLSSLSPSKIQAPRPLIQHIQKGHLHEALSQQGSVQHPDWLKYRLPATPSAPMQQRARAQQLPSLDLGPTTQPSIREATGFPRAREFLPHTLKILRRSLFSCGQRPPRPVCTPAGHSQSVLSSKSTEGHGSKLFRCQMCSILLVACTAQVCVFS